MRMHNEQSMSHHNMANDQPIPVYLKTTRQMTGCYGIDALRTISLWIPYLPPRREANHPEATPVANYSSQIRGSYMQFL